MALVLTMCGWCSGSGVSAACCAQNVRLGKEHALGLAPQHSAPVRCNYVIVAAAAQATWTTCLPGNAGAVVVGSEGADASIIVVVRGLAPVAGGQLAPGACSTRLGARAAHAPAGGLISRKSLLRGERTCVKIVVVALGRKGGAGSTVEVACHQRDRHQANPRAGGGTVGVLDGQPQRLGATVRVIDAARPHGGRVYILGTCAVQHC